MCDFDQIKAFSVKINGNVLPFRLARARHQLAPGQDQLLAVEQRDLSVGSDIEWNAIDLSRRDLSGVILNAGFPANLAAEKIPDLEPQIALPIVEPFQPRLLARQLLLDASEGMRILEFGKKLDGIVHAVNTEIQ